MQTSINTLLLTVLQSVQSSRGMTGKQFSYALKMSSANWSKINCGQRNIGIDLIYRAICYDTGNFMLKDLFGVIDHYIMTLDGYSQDIGHLEVKVTPDNLQKQQYWDALLYPEFFDEPIKELIRSGLNATGALSLANMDEDDGLFLNPSSQFFLEQKDMTRFQQTIYYKASFPEESINMRWISKANEKIRCNLLSASRPFAMIDKVRKSDPEFADTLSEIYQKMRLMKIGSGKLDDFHSSEAGIYWAEQKENIRGKFKKKKSSNY